MVEAAPTGVEEIPVRHAAKAVVMMPPSEQFESPSFLLLESEKSGRFNIPGGGVDKSETPLEAFTREIREELGAKALEAVAYLEIIGRIKGPATTSDGKKIFADWTLLLMVLSDNKELIKGEGIAELHWLTAKKVLRHKEVTKMAKRAVRLSIKRGFDDLLPVEKDEAPTRSKATRGHLSLVVS